MTGVFANALDDIRQGLKMRRVWLALAQEDIGDQHRRTALGPLWLLLNYLILAGTFVFLFRRGAGIPDYVAYVSTGLLVWFYIMEVINLSVSLFVREESFIKGTRLPLSVYVLRLEMQSVIRAGYALIGCAVFLAMSDVSFNAAWGWSGLGILLILATAPAAIIVFAFLGAFFPDSQFIVSNVMRVGMFLTPVFWAYREGDDGVRHTFYHFNPFTYFLEIVRVPILSGEFPARSFTVCLIICLCLWFTSLVLLGTLRRRIVFAL